MLKEFKQFILRGNVIDLAVGIVIGSAFTAVVKSVVSDIITPLIATLYKSQNFETASFTFRNSKFLYGDLVNSLIAFLIVALVVFFFVVEPFNRLNQLAQKRKGALDPTTKQCPECLGTIPLDARRCMYCTTKLS